MNTDLTQYGWDDFFASAKKLTFESHLEHGRVISVHKLHYDVILETGMVTCDILGTVQFQKDPLALPAVGDWVLVDWHASTPVIHQVLIRKTILKRQKKHDTFPKPIAANIDTALIMQSVEQDFNINRLERILVHVREAKVKPIVVINKIDKISDEQLILIRNELKNLGVPVFYISVKEKTGIHDIELLFKQLETIVFIGSSGVGKSSLLNLIDAEILQKTQEIMDKTGKGKHTTTARTLFKTKTGVLIIDTPGTREFGMYSDDNEAIEESFDIISEIAAQCRFSDCGHGNEPDCEIQKALTNRELDKEKYNRYLVLSQENTQSPKQIRQNEKQSSKSNTTNQPLRSVRRGKGPKK